MSGDSARVALSVRWFWLDTLDADAVRACCTDAEAASVERLATPTLRRRAVASLAARRIAVGEALGVEPGSVALMVAPDGRRLAAARTGDPVAISVSTSGSLGLVAVATTGAVGADVEGFDGVPTTPAFVGRITSPDERAALATLDAAERDAALLRLWTRKEAYLKATGEGIGGGLSTVDVPTDPVVFAARFDPRGDGARWWCYDLDVPADGRAAAVVVGPAAGNGAAEPAVELDVAVR